MPLSYAYRILCVAVSATALLHLALELVAWRLSPVLTRDAICRSPRSLERRLFLLALGTRIAPVALVAACLVPAYIRGEDNVSLERVGIVSVILCATGAIWALGCALRVISGLWKMHLDCRRCRKIGIAADGSPILLHPSDRLLLAVGGIFSPRIILSKGALERSSFSDAALNTALAHECAHIRQCDNLKLLLLSLLPHVDIASANRPSLRHQWRLFAELAADEESVRGQQERSILLAEMLVTVARDSSRLTPRASVALLSREEDLRTRVERLLRLAQPGATSTLPRRDPRTLAALLLFAASCIVMAYACARLGHPFAEGLLRLG